MLSLWVPTLHALDVSYGNFFKITGITRAEGQLSMPLERKQYHNIRIGSKDTYQFVSSCKAPCRQPASVVELSVHEVRPAKTRPDMWIATVDFNRAWFVTFLIFRRGEQYTVKPPAQLQFLDTSLKAQTEERVMAAVKQQIR